MAVGLSGMVASVALWTGRRSRPVLAALLIFTALAAAWTATLIVSPTAYTYPALAVVVWAAYLRGRPSSAP